MQSINFNPGFIDWFHAKKPAKEKIIKAAQDAIPKNLPVAPAVIPAIPVPAPVLEAPIPPVPAPALEAPTPPVPAPALEAPTPPVTALVLEAPTPPVPAPALEAPTPPVTASVEVPTLAIEVQVELPPIPPVIEMAPAIESPITPLIDRSVTLIEPASTVTTVSVAQRVLAQLTLRNFAYLLVLASAVACVAYIIYKWQFSQKVTEPIEEVPAEKVAVLETPVMEQQIVERQETAPIAESSWGAEGVIKGVLAGVATAFAAGFFAKKSRNHAEPQTSRDVSTTESEFSPPPRNPNPESKTTTRSLMMQELAHGDDRNSIFEASAQAIYDDERDLRNETKKILLSEQESSHRAKTILEQEDLLQQQRRVELLSREMCASGDLQKEENIAAKVLDGFARSILLSNFERQNRIQIGGESSSLLVQQQGDEFLERKTIAQREAEREGLNLFEEFQRGKVFVEQRRALSSLNGNRSPAPKTVSEGTPKIGPATTFDSSSIASSPPLRAPDFTSPGQLTGFGVIPQRSPSPTQPQDEVAKARQYAIANNISNSRNSIERDSSV